MKESRKKLSRREFLRNAAVFTAAMVATACNKKSPIAFSGLPSIDKHPVEIPTNNSDIFSQAELEIITLLIKKANESISKGSLRELIAKLSSLISQEIQKIETRSLSDSSTAHNLLTQLDQATNGQAVETINLQPESENLERWQNISVYIYLLGLSLKKAGYPQNAFNILSLARTISSPLASLAPVDWNEYVKTGDSLPTLNINPENQVQLLSSLVAYIQLDIPNQLSALIEDGGIEITPTLRDQLHDVISGINEKQFNLLMNEARVIEAMPVNTTEEKNAKEIKVKELLYKFYDQMSRTLQDRGVITTDDERLKWIQEGGEGYDLYQTLWNMVAVQETSRIPAESRTYSYLINEQAITGTYHKNQDVLVTIPPISFSSIQNHIKKNYPEIACRNMMAVAQLRTQINESDKYSDEDFITAAIENGVIIIDHCSHQQIVDSESTGQPRWCTLIALRGLRSNNSNANFMIAIPDDNSSEVLHLSGAFADHHYKVLSTLHDDIRIGGNDDQSSGYSVVETLELLRAFYSNPSLHHNINTSPAELLLASPSRVVEQQIRPGMYMIYVPPNANCYGLTPTEQGYEAQNLTAGEEAPFGECGTTLTLHENSKISVISPETGLTETFYILQEGEEGKLVAVKATETVSIPQRTFLQLLKDSSHNLLFWITLIGNYPITIDRIQPLGTATLDAAIGVKFFAAVGNKAGVKGIPIPAGVQRLIFKFLESGKETSKAQTLVAGLPVKLVTEEVLTESYGGRIITGAKLVKRTVLVKIFQSLQAVSAYLIYKSLTKEQTSNLSAFITASQPYLQNAGNIFDEQKLLEFGAETISC